MRRTPQLPRRLMLAPCLWLAAASAAHAQDQWQGLEPARPAAQPQAAGVLPATPAPAAPARAERSLDDLQREINAQTQRLDELRNSLAQQEQAVADLQRALDEERLDAERGAGVAPGTVLPTLAQQAPVASQAPPSDQPQAPAAQPQQQQQQKQKQQQDHDPDVHI